jgi:FSR family fosmidomycin resistance protein-like MFS transporter
MSVQPLRMDRRIMALLGLSHAADDINQSFLPALLPLLVSQRHLSYTAAASLVLAQGLSSSVIQPAIGFLADRHPMPWLIAVGLLLAGAGVAVIGIVDSYELIFLGVLISGMGAAFFHPEGARFANLSAGAKKASGVRWFSLGGSVGFALGPLFATGVLALFGMAGTALALVPVAIMATLLLLALPRMRALLPNAGGAKSAAALPDDWSAFARLTGFIVMRSTAYIGTVSFIPLYFVHVAGAPVAVANGALTAFLAIGIVGTFVCGDAADRFGKRAVLVVLGAIPLAFTPLLVAATGGGGGVLLGYAICAVLGFALSGSQPATIVLGQEYLPNRMGTAAGVTLGLAFTIGGMFAPVLGAIGDRYGLAWSMLALAAVSAGSLTFALSLPDPVKRRALLGRSLGTAP